MSLEITQTIYRTGKPILITHAACGLDKALCMEYTHRYDKTHKCEAVIQDCITNTPEFDHTDLTEHAQAMDDEYKLDNPVFSYRNYYNKAKSHLHSWKNRPVPIWIS